MTAHDPHDAIALEALPAIEELESERGNAHDFAQSEMELHRLERRWDLRYVVNIVAIMAVIFAFNILERPYGYAAVIAIVVAQTAFRVWWQRTPRARAIKRVKRAITDWLAFGRTAQDA